MSETSRFRSLEGILAKPPAKRTPPHAVDPGTAEAEPEEATPARAPAPTQPEPRASTARTRARAPQTAAPVAPPPAAKRSTGPRGTRAPSQTTGGTRRVAFRLEEDLARRLSERVTQDRTSQGHVVLDAVETAHGAGTLSDLVAAQKRPSAGTGTLFARPVIRGAASASVATEIRLDAGTLAVLDDLVASAGADTRTQLIVAALQAHLG